MYSSTSICDKVVLVIKYSGTNLIDRAIIYHKMRSATKRLLFRASTNTDKEKTLHKMRGLFLGCSPGCRFHGKGEAIKYFYCSAFQAYLMRLRVCGQNSRKTKSAAGLQNLSFTLLRRNRLSRFLPYYKKLKTQDQAAVTVGAGFTFSMSKANFQPLYRRQPQAARTLNRACVMYLKNRRFFTLRRRLPPTLFGDFLF